MLLVAAAFAVSAQTPAIEPPNIVLAGAGASQRILTPCPASSSAPSVAVVRDGAVHAVGPGTADIRLSCGGSSQVVVTGTSRPAGVGFARDVLSVLTTKGCNSSSCHGSPAGQAGFKLSLYGADQAADYKSIVVDRRVNRTEPSASLLLKKPSFQVPHGGGHLMTKESDEYRTLLRWLEQGAKLDSDGPRVTAIELYPRERILTGHGATQSLAVIGRLSDGSTRDLTNEVRYAVGDESIVSGPNGNTITAKSRGLTVLTARAFGLTATAQYTVIDRAADASYPATAANNFIDEFVYSKLRQVNIAPYPLSDDRTFVRRVYLDAIGILPTPAEAARFVGSASPNKRAELIDQLLARREYATHWLMKFEDWFRNSQYYSQGRTNGSYKRWLRELIEEDRPYDQAVREMLTATGDTTVRPAGNFWHPAIDFMLKTFDVKKATPTVTRLFLGQRIECAECHNHPLENLTQDDFYGMAAFFGKLRVKHGYGQYRRVWYTARDGDVLHPVTKQPVKPRLLDGTAPETGDDPRVVLADWITRAQKQQFARATVNRVWAEYFTRGIVEPPDDFRSTNRPTHPELLDKLAEHFVAGGFRFKALHRVILNSRTYQLAAHTADRPGGADPMETVLFARYEPRKLSAEVLLDAVTQVTGVAPEFSGYPAGTSPKELIAGIGRPAFLETFGFPQRDIMGPRNEAPSMAQSLHLMNNDALRNRIEKPENALAALLANPDDSAAVDSLYQSAYSRSPTPKQKATILLFLADEQKSGRTRRRAYENLLWAILNSKEFQLNQ